MKKLFLFYLLSVPLLLNSNVFAQSDEKPVNYVKPDIGGVSHLLTSTNPVVQLPHGYPQVTPLLNPGITDSYLATKIYGFPAGGVSLMPTVGAVKANPGDIASNFDRDFETRTPYYYKGLLEDSNIHASYTVGHFTVFYRFKFPENKDRRVNIRMKNNGNMRIVSSTIVQGSTSIDNVPHYFYLKFSKPIKSISAWSYNSNVSNKHSIKGRKIGFSLKFSSAGNKTIQVKVGLSFISLGQAEKNLNKAIDGWNFARRKERTKARWSKLLGKIQVEGGTEKQKTIFYSSLYRAEQNMMDITEGGRYYSGFDHKVHSSNGRDFYTRDQLWDTFRCEHPLQLLLNPKQQENMIRSYIRMYGQWGWLPSFPRIAGEFPAMIGDHADQLIADTYFKGYHDFNVEKAYQAMKHAALHGTMLPWRRGKMTNLGKIYCNYSA